MGLESTINTIADLNVTWPTDGDVASQGDNHLRLIKDAVKKTFPNISAVVTPTATDLNTRLVPSGVILMWSGSIASIPANWYLCDGTNGTPNLRDRFIVGAGTTYAVGATGGATTVTLSAAQIPAHTHTYSGTTGGQNADHSHTGYTGVDGAHGHRFTYGTRIDSNNGGFGGAYFGTPIANPLAGGVNTIASSDGMVTATNSAHQHSVQTYGASNSHGHEFSGTTSSIGSSASHENLPPYYALAYIQKS